MTIDAQAWLELCRAAGAAVARAVAELPTRDEREPVLSIGEGGDETTAVDAAAEEAVVAVLERSGLDFTLVSEELGERVFGDGSGPVVVVDPIDGSLNAKRGVPWFALSIAIAEGPAMGDVVVGFVQDFGTGEEWTAIRGEGAWLDGVPLAGPGPKETIEVLVMEATLTDLLAEKVGAMVGFAYRTRVFGSLALALCHLAAGRVDAVCSLKPARSVDIAAAQLLVLEQELAIRLPDDPPFSAAPLDLAGRSRVVAAATDELCVELYRRLGA